jgi:uncharacterized membrane protein YhaH (DUF805 family)
MKSLYKKCPNCWEKIKETVEKCRHCWTIVNLTGENANDTENYRSTEIQMKKTFSKKFSGDWFDENWLDETINDYDYNRMNRRIFFRNTVILFCTEYLFVLLLVLIGNRVDNPITDADANILSIIMSIIFLWFRIPRGIKRCHDMGLSGWWIIIWIIPIISLGLYLIPWTNWDNVYDLWIRTNINNKTENNMTCWKRFWKYILYLLRDWFIFLVLDGITQWFWIRKYNIYADSHFTFDMFVCFIIFIIETVRLISDCSKIKKMNTR